MKIIQVLVATILLSLVMSAPPSTGGGYKWEINPELSDEFNSGSIDTNKWNTNNPYSDGPSPGIWMDKNSKIENGELVQTCNFINNGAIRNIESAWIDSKKKQLYGYFEIKAKVMNSKAASNFWFYSWVSDNETYEIDVVQTGGDDLMNMYMNFNKNEQNKDSQTYEHTADLSDGYHLYGFEWTQNNLKWYFDNQVVRTEPNNLFYKALNMKITTGVFQSWLGLPTQNSLPAEFRIDYARSWVSVDTCSGGATLNGNVCGDLTDDLDTTPGDNGNGNNECVSPRVTQDGVCQDSCNSGYTANNSNVCEKDAVTNPDPNPNPNPPTNGDSPRAGPPLYKKWTLDPEMSDEFTGNGPVNATKWDQFHKYTDGPKPGIYTPANSYLVNNMAHLKTNYIDNGSDRYIQSGYLTHKIRAHYGYFEIYAKTMISKAASAFWFYEWRPTGTWEIDVFEVGGTKTHVVNSNYHYFVGDDQYQNWSNTESDSQQYEHTEPIGNDFHLFALEWDEDYYKYYFDGKLIRTTVNNHFHVPMFMKMTTEISAGWLGIPDRSELPQEYVIDYVRVYKPVSSCLSNQVLQVNVCQDSCNSGFKADQENICISDGTENSEVVPDPEDEDDDGEEENEVSAQVMIYGLALWLVLALLI